MNAPAVLFGLALCLAAFTVARALLAPRRSSAARAGDLCRSFGLDPAQYRVLGADVGGYPTPFSIRADGLIGRPDAVFIRVVLPDPAGASTSVRANSRLRAIRWSNSGRTRRSERGREAEEEPICEALFVVLFVKFFPIRVG